MPKGLTKDQDKERVSALFNFDENIKLSISKNENSIVLGIDEVGRGPLAGPVAAGGVIFRQAEYIEFLNDSKKITEKRRPLVAKKIEELALFSTVCMVDTKTIDDVGIIESLKLAFREVILGAEKANIFPDVILVDGNKIDLGDSRVHCVVKGDSKSASIAAASVVAKVARDSYMFDLAKDYPEYAWDKNKGYGTKSHLDAIKNSGISPYHRKTFLKNIDFKAVDV